SPGDPVAVQGAQSVERLKHHQVQGPLQNFSLRLAHGLPLWSVNRSKHSARSVECQQGRRNTQNLDCKRVAHPTCIRLIGMIQLSTMENSYQCGSEHGAGQQLDHEDEMAEDARTISEGGQRF